jgi:hypothetical protein
MTVGDEDHGGIPVTMPVAFGRLDQLVDFSGSKVLASVFAVREPANGTWAYRSIAGDAAQRPQRN